MTAGTVLEVATSGARSRIWIIEADGRERAVFVVTMPLMPIPGQWVEWDAVRPGIVWWTQQMPNGAQRRGSLSQIGYCFDPATDEARSGNYL